MNAFRCLLGIFLLGNFCALQGQSVSVSPEVNIKNDFAYYFFPHHNGTVSLIRDKSFRLSIQTLTIDNGWSSERSIELSGKKWRVIDIYESKGELDILYTTRIDEDQVLIKARYNTQGVLLHEKFILEGVHSSMIKNLYAYSSENKNWVCIRYDDAKALISFILYNRIQDSIYYKKNLNEGIAEVDDMLIKGIEVSDRGEVFIHGRNEDAEQKKNKKIEFVQAIDITGQFLAKSLVATNETNLFQTRIRVDNKNNHLICVGLYAEKNGKYPEGYFYYLLNKDTQSTSVSKKIPFTPDMLKEWKGEYNLKREWKDGELKLQDIVFAKNGGCVLFFENTKEISRRPYFSSIDPSTNFTSRWFDYYFDDVLGVHLDALGNIIWERVLHKRQYSQDDEGIFSSFFIFKTPALLRIIFNDAVNSDGTVSEYLLKPNGDHIRKSVLNTTYKNLNLRFRDAIELNAESLLIPSEDNGKLTLVRIQFD